MATKKKTSKRAPVKKKTGGRKKTKKKKASKTSSKAEPEQLDIEKEAEKKTTKGRKRKPPQKSDVPFSGPMELHISEEIAEQLRKLHEKLDNKDELVTMTAVVKAGLESMDGVLAPASGNLIDDDEDDPYDPEFEDAFQAHVTGQA